MTFLAIISHDDNVPFVLNTFSRIVPLPLEQPLSETADIFVAEVTFNTAILPVFPGYTARILVNGKPAIVHEDPDGFDPRHLDPVANAYQ